MTVEFEFGGDAIPCENFHLINYLVACYDINVGVLLFMSRRFYFRWIGCSL